MAASMKDNEGAPKNAALLALELALLPAELWKAVKSLTLKHLSAAKVDKYGVAAIWKVLMRNRNRQRNLLHGKKKATASAADLERFLRLNRAGNTPGLWLAENEKAMLLQDINRIHYLFEHPDIYTDVEEPTLEEKAECIGHLIPAQLAKLPAKLALPEDRMGNKKTPKKLRAAGALPNAPAQTTQVAASWSQATATGQTSSWSQELCLNWHTSSGLQHVKHACLSRTQLHANTPLISPSELQTMASTSEQPITPSDLDPRDLVDDDIAVDVDSCHALSVLVAATLNDQPLGTMLPRPPTIFEYDEITMDDITMDDIVMPDTVMPDTLDLFPAGSAELWQFLELDVDM
eukprot:m.26131 g.26131  ORF g.26131 m.26131 type:complete len:348 (+) comp11660_c0_seq1:662-1705(+)